MNAPIYFLACSLFIASIAVAQTTPAVQITGDSIQPFTLTAAGFAGLSQTALELKGHDEKLHRYEGVLLADILAKAGIRIGVQSRKSTATTYLTIKAADNYTCVYALAEIDTLFTGKIVILANKQDGAALPKNAGPFQVIATGEKLHARWIRQVTSIAVSTAH